MFKRYVELEGLTSLIGSSGDYSITILGKIKDRRVEDVPQHLDEEGHSVVNLVSWDGRRDYRVIDLVAIHFKDFYIPKENYNDVVAFVIDGDKTNHHPENIGYRFKKRLAVPGMPRFFYVPCFTKYGISEEGVLYNTVTQEFPRWYVTPPNPKKNIKGGYVVYSYSSRGIRAPFSRHRAMCLTFLGYPDNCDSLVVNHKNGVPGMDEIDNLEWCTRSQNNTHAYVSDLKSQHMRVLCRDVMTDKVVEYYSISECARVLGYPTDETIRFRLYKCKFGQVFGDGKQFKFKDDPRDWIIPADAKQAIVSGENSHKVILRNCATMQEFEFESVAEAGRISGINSGTLMWRLNRSDKKPVFGWQIRSSYDEGSFPDFTRKEYLDSLTPSQQAVDCRNLLTGETRHYDSVNKAVKAFGSTQISQDLRSGKQPLLSSGWQIKFENETWEGVDNFEEEIYRRALDIMAREEATGKLIIAGSSRQMALIVGRDNKSVRTAALTRGKKVYHGYRFRLGVSDAPWPTDGN